MYKIDEKLEQRKKLICELVADDAYVPMKEKELAVLMQVPREERTALREVLQALLAEGRLQVNGQGRYSKPDADKPVGTFISNARGTGSI